MHKQIRFNPDVYKWLNAHADTTSPNQILSVVRWTPESWRNYYKCKPRRFTVEFRRKVGGQIKRVLVRVDETEEELVILLCHSETV